MNPWTPPHRGVEPDSPAAPTSTDKVPILCRATPTSFVSVGSSRLNTGRGSCGSGSSSQQVSGGRSMPSRRNPSGRPERSGSRRRSPKW